MSNISIVLSALLTLALALVIAPNILAMNRGRILRNIALWLAIVLALALVYENFGPGKSGELGNGGALSSAPASTPDKDDDSDSTAPPAGDQGFTPPKEE